MLMLLRICRLHPRVRYHSRASEVLIIPYSVGKKNSKQRFLKSETTIRRNFDKLKQANSETFTWYILVGSPQHAQPCVMHYFCASLPNLYTTSWLTCKCPVRNHVPENRQGNNITIPVRYAQVNCSSVQQWFSYEVSFSPFFPLYSKPILKRKALV